MARTLGGIALAAVFILASMTPAMAQAASSPAETERITIAELKNKLDSGETFLLIDVREDWELEQDGAIPGAIRIPVGDLEKRMADIPKDVELVFY